MSCNRGMVNHLVGMITILNDWTSRSTGDTVPKVRRPKKGWFRPSKKKPRRGPLVAPSERGYLLVRHVENGVCRKIIIVKKFIVVRVELLPNVHGKSNMLQSLRCYCRSDEEPHRMPWVSRVMGDLSGFKGE